MRYSQNEVTSILAGIERTLSGANVNAWQTKFLIDMRAKFQNFGTKTSLSAKQANKLSEIIGSTGSVTDSRIEKSKVTNQAWGPSPRPSPRQSGSATGGRTPNLKVIRNTIGQSYSPKRYWRKKRTTSFIGRELRWFKRRLLRGLVILSVLGLLIAGSGLFNYLTGGSTDRAAPRYYTSELSKRDFSVTDGDTIQIHSESKGTRLIGFNTPEGPVRGNLVETSRVGK